MLGPLEVRTDDDSGIMLDVGGSRLRALLIMLALRPGQLVPASQLIDGLWADQPPAGAANALQALVSRLRRALPDAVIESRPAGYQLKLDPRSTDIVRFEELAAKGRTQLRNDPAAAAATLRGALALWRGPALLQLAILRAGDPPAAPAQAEPPPRAPSAPRASPARSNLRAELTSFVGRDNELAHVAELLRANRLVTLTGPGGAGKTRLAVEAARAEVAAMPDGVWLVELAPVADPADLTSTVLGVFGLREQPLLYGGKPLTARLPPGQAAAPDEQAAALGRLLTALAAQRTMLVLDNCEHLIEAAATLADRILAACPQVRVLATSREPLNITGEALWTVGPLTLPPDPAVSSGISERPGPLAPRPAGPPPGIDAYASVSLLIQRARAVARILRGHVTVNCGRQHVQAEEDFLAATGIFTALGERWGLAIALGGLAILEGWRGEHPAGSANIRYACGEPPMAPPNT
jgi:DNA-binding winged helix-turn-helix (wHTH) protein